MSAALTDLVQLHDGRAGLRAGFEVQVRAEAAPAVLEVIASSAMLDRCDEIIEPAGWRLENYRRNPVFQNSHCYGDVLHTLGRALETDVRPVGGQLVLYQRLQFAIDVNPIARICYGLYAGGFLRAVSVGFVPLRWEVGAADAAFRRRYLEQELLEVSAVAIPANPEALALGLRSGAIARKDLQELVAIGARVSGATGDPSSLPAEMLLARQLREVLKGG